jgi:hypothetical protein
MTTRKSVLSWHVQLDPPSWLRADIARAQPPFVKQMQPGADDPYPGSLTIGRAWIGGDQAEAALIAQGAEGGTMYWHQCLAQYETAPWVHAWEAPNEPSVSTVEQRRNLVAFTRKWLRLMHLSDRRGVVLNLSVGWPDVGTAAELAGALEGADFVGLHEYSSPTMWTGEGWYCLRYRGTLAEWQAAEVEVPPVLISELGIDGGTSGQPRTGWKTFTTERGYRDQLQWYDEAVCGDERVAAAFVFGAAPEATWADFEVTPGLSTWLAGLTRRKVRAMEIVARKVTVEEFAALADTLDLRGRYDEEWVHHTASKPEAWQGEQTLRGLQSYYEGLGWDSGPHIFVYKGEIWLFTPMDRDGTGVVGHNYRTRHMEIVGDYTDHLPDGETWSTATAAAAIMLRAGGLDISRLHYHRQGQATQCPGAALIKAWPVFTAEVAQHLAPAPGPAGEHGDLATLAEKARWWAEEFDRLRKDGTPTALAQLWAFWPDYIALLYRVERLAKSGEGAE